jgi:hypothetical protein
MPWPGDPRINLQKDGPKVQRYPIVQMPQAIDKRTALNPARVGDAARVAVSRRKGK